MPIAIILGKLWENKRLVFELISATIVVGLIYWFGIHIPAELKKSQAEVKTQIERAETAESQVIYLDEVQKGKGKINAAVQTQISTMRSLPVRRNTVIIRGGRVLQDLPKNISTSN